MLRLQALNEVEEEDESANWSAERSDSPQVEKAESDLVSVYNEAMCLIRDSKNADAESKLYRVIDSIDHDLKICSDHRKTEITSLKYSALKNLALLSQTVGQKEKAIDYYLQASLLNEEDLNLWWKLSQLAMECDHHRMARYALEKALVCHPRHYPSLDRIISLLYVLGDYHSCLQWSCHALGMDPCLSTALVFRDKIFEEDPDAKMFYRSERALLSPYLSLQLCPARRKELLEEAAFLREKRRVAAIKELEPSVKFTKEIASYTWSALADALLQLYDDLVTSNSSIISRVDVEKYCRTSEQIELEKRKGVKRKRNVKAVTKITDKHGDPSPKRRSARSRNATAKDEDGGVGVMLSQFLPAFCTLDPQVNTADANTAGSYADDVTSSQKEEFEVVPSEEIVSCSQFFVQNVENGGCLNLMLKYLVCLSTWPPDKWSSDMPLSYLHMYICCRKHIIQPCLFSAPSASDTSSENLRSFGLVTLLSLEIQVDLWCTPQSRVLTGCAGRSLQLLQASNNTLLIEDQFLSDMRFLATLSNSKASFGASWDAFYMRFLWMQANYFVHARLTSSSIDVLTNIQRYYTIILNPARPGQVFQTCCCLDGCIISEVSVGEKLRSLSKELSLESLQELFDRGEFEKVADTLLTLYKEQMGSPEETPLWTQFGLLSMSLVHLGRYSECIQYTAEFLHGCLPQLAPSAEWKDLMSQTLSDLITSIRHVKLDDPCLHATLAKLVDALVRLVESSLDLGPGEVPVVTITPWMILFYLMKGFRSLAPAEPQQQGGDGSVPLNITLVSFIGFIHNKLGRKEWCCEQGGSLLVEFVLELVPAIEDPSRFSPEEVEEVRIQLEQCFFCLYGYPPRKNRSLTLQDHGTSQVPLTLPMASHLFRFFVPHPPPSVASKQISQELNQLLKRILDVIPAGSLDVMSVEQIQAYLEGTEDLPAETSTSAKTPDFPNLYYLMADFYYKSGEYGKTVRYLLHDLATAPSKFESWLLLGITKSQVFSDKLGSFETKRDSSMNKLIKAILIAFERSVALSPSSLHAWLEYGRTAYLISSYTSRKLWELSVEDNGGEDGKTLLETRRREMLQLAQQCFAAAGGLMDANDEIQWFVSFMLGKCAEKLHGVPEVYLNHYAASFNVIKSMSINVPKRLSYGSNPDMSKEYLEVFYRGCVSVLKCIRSGFGNYMLLQKFLDGMQDAPFFPAEAAKLKFGIQSRSPTGMILSETPLSTGQEKSCTMPEQTSNERSLEPITCSPTAESIVDLCLAGLLGCIQRYPEHYKSHMAAARVFASLPSHRHPPLARAILLGPSEGRDLEGNFLINNHGLLNDRSKTNLFQHLWKVGVDDIERAGSFCRHICSVLQLTLDVLSDLKECDPLLAVSVLLHRTPERERKYIRDGDRLLFAVRAADLALQILAAKVELTTEDTPRPQRELLLKSCQDLYKHLQRMQSASLSAETVLLASYNLLLERDTASSTSGLPKEAHIQQALKYPVGSCADSVIPVVQ